MPPVFLRFHQLEILFSVLAQRTEEVVRHGLALVNIAADGADSVFLQIDGISKRQFTSATESDPGSRGEYNP